MLSIDRRHLPTANYRDCQLPTIYYLSGNTLIRHTRGLGFIKTSKAEIAVI